jgi:hypothetical protein
MAKKPIRERLACTKTAVRWRISLLKGTPAKFLGYVEAPNEKAAIEAAAKEYKIAEALQALAQSGPAATVAPSLLDIPTGPRFRPQGRPDIGPLPASLGEQALGGRDYVLCAKHP